MKKFGIYLAYPPGVDLRGEGLGMHLSEFLKGAEARGDVQFVVACPSWMKKRLIELFDATGVTHGSFEIIAPKSLPPTLVIYEFITGFLKRPKKQNSRLVGLMRSLVTISTIYSELSIKKIVGTRSFVLLALLGFFLFPIFLLVVLIKLIITIVLLLGVLLRKFFTRLTKNLSLVNQVFNKVSVLSSQPKESSYVVQLYRILEESEASLMKSLIDARHDVAAWYSPTAFWPQFNQINAPRLMSVPDVVLTEFPVGFSLVGGQRFLGVFEKVEEAIQGGQYFVTYSENVKWRTLVERYYTDPESVFVVPHGANRLDELVVVTGFPDNEAATDSLCRNLFKAALSKAINHGEALRFGNENVKFIFYASQIRPNKNVMTLLKAYENLLKRRFIGHKLVLTGNPNIQPEIARFIKEKNLENDVLCLHKLSSQELAACYRLADLVVNPSISEGGCPFTFTEALSVGTPVVMARIAVTEEVITNRELQQQMLFDPYDWKDMADKIHYGLDNKQALLTKQLPFYEQLSSRTWKIVVDDYINILDSISSN